MNEITKARLVEYMGHLPAREAKRKIDYELIYALTDAGYTPLEISRRMEINRATVEYRLRKRAAQHFKEKNDSPDQK